MGEEIKQTLIYLKQSQIEKLDKISKKVKINRSQLVRLIIDEGIEKIEKNGLQLKLF